MRPRQFRKQLAARQRALCISLGNLVQAPAPETLHELRADLRRLCALLRPLAGRKAFAPLIEQSGLLLAATNPLRDLEVLADDLELHRQKEAAARRRHEFQAALHALLATPPWRDFESRCQPPAETAPLVALPERDALAQRYRKTVGRDIERLRRRLDAPRLDLQRLRLDIRTLRYQLEEQEYAGVEKALKLLARLQDQLGDWHDRRLWLALAETETDLRPCVARWRREQAECARWLPELVARLRRLLGTAPA